MAQTTQVVLITGCSSGIGRALAIEFATRGYRVVATGRHGQDLVALAGNPEITVAELDVNDPKSIADAVRETILAYGQIDILVNNAGFNLIGPLAEVNLADVRRLLETNLVGLLAVSQSVIPHMVRRRQGRIVNIGSIVAVLPTPFEGAYCASKAAVHLLSETLRIEVRSFGIEIVEVQPGMVHSAIASKAVVDHARHNNPDSLYRHAAEAFLHRREGLRGKRTDTQVFARKLAGKIVRRNPPRVVRLGRGAKILPLAMTLIPGTLRDWALRRIFGL